MLTLIVAVVAPVFHFTLPVLQVALKLAVSLPHSKVLLALTTGAVGLFNVLISIGSEASLVPHEFVHLTVVLHPHRK